MNEFLRKIQPFECLTSVIAQWRNDYESNYIQSNVPFNVNSKFVSVILPQHPIPC